MLSNLNDIKETETFSEGANGVGGIDTTLEVFWIVNHQVIDEARHWPNETNCD